MYPAPASANLCRAFKTKKSKADQKTTETRQKDSKSIMHSIGLYATFKV
jgi:hypothetical protein